jgi:hypothetical protein
MSDTDDTAVDPRSIVADRSIKSDSSVEGHYDRLRENGRWFWTDEMMPEDLLSEETKEVLDTKSEFISILEASSSDELVENLMTAGTMTPSLAIRHCMLATDIGMETIDRVADYISFYDINTLQIQGDGVDTTYPLRWLGNQHGNSTNLSNSDLDDDNEDLLWDICTLLSFGEYVNSFADYPTFDRCKLGTICGDEGAIADYFADLYVLFSPQTRGRVAVKKGKIAENVAGEMLERVVSASPSLSFAEDSRVPDVPSEGDDQQFDYVVRIESSPVQYVAIECAFQETTNSVIERKARQSRELYPSFVDKDYYLCFVVDGDGYYKRSNALKQMIQYSDLAVGFDELDELRALLQTLANQA